MGANFQIYIIKNAKCLATFKKTNTHNNINNSNKNKTDLNDEIHYNFVINKKKHKEHKKIQTENPLVN